MLLTGQIDNKTAIWSSSLPSYLYYWQQWQSTRLHPDARWAATFHTNKLVQLWLLLWWYYDYVFRWQTHEWVLLQCDRTSSVLLLATYIVQCVCNRSVNNIYKTFWLMDLCNSYSGTITMIKFHKHLWALL